MNKIVISRLLLTGLIIVPTITNAHSSCYTTPTINVNQPTNAYDVQKTLVTNPTTSMQDAFVNDADLNRIITASAAGIAFSTIISIIIAQIVEYVKNAKIREANRELEVARLKNQLKVLQS